MRVPNYTRGLVLDRPVGNEVDLRQIDAAGQIARGAADVLNTGAQVSQQIEKTNDMTAVNGAVIKRQKDDLDFQAEMRKQNQDNPLGFAKKIEPEYQKRDEEIMASLPSERARQAYKETADKLNLRNYESDLNWEVKRSTEMFANKADQSIKDLEVMAYRGVPLEELKKQRQATTMTLGSVLAQDQLIKFDQKAEERITSSYLEGMIDSNPYEAKKILDSKQYDNALGVDKLQSLTNSADSAIRKAETKAIELSNKRTKQMTDDPAQLAIDSGVPPNDYKQLVATQKELGVAEGNISIIPKQQASFMVNQFEGIKNSDELISQLASIEQEVGKDNYALAMKDLKRAGLSDNVALMSMMRPEEDKRVMDAAIAMTGKDREDIIKKATSKPDVTVAKIEDAIAPLLEDTLTIFSKENPAGEAQTARMQRTMVDIATYRISKGDSIESAAQLATEWLNKQVVPASINGNLFRVPAITTPDEIEDALEDAIYSTKFSKIPIEDADIKRSVTPVLYGEEKYYLKDKSDLPIEDESGNVIFYDIVDIIKKKKEKDRTKSEQIGKEAYNIGD